MQRYLKKQFFQGFRSLLSFYCAVMNIRLEETALQPKDSRAVGTRQNMF